MLGVGCCLFNMPAGTCAATHKQESDFTSITLVFNRCLELLCTQVHVRLKACFIIVEQAQMASRTAPMTITQIDRATTANIRLLL